MNSMGSMAYMRSSALDAHTRTHARTHAHTHTHTKCDTTHSYVCDMAHSYEFYGRSVTPVCSSALTYTHAHSF